MGAYANMDEKIAGMKLGVSESSRVASFRVAEANGIAFGDPVFGYDDDALNGYKAHEDTQTIVWDADFVASNSIVVSIATDGAAAVAGTAVVFNASQAQTMLDLEAQLETDFASIGLVVTRTDVAGNNRTLELHATGHTIVATEAVTLGASQATGTITDSTKQVFLGVALFTQLAHVENSGLYEYEDAMNVMEYGLIYVNAFEAVEANTLAYVAVDGTVNEGKFGTSGYDVGCRYRESVTAAGLVLVEVRGQKG